MKAMLAGFAAIVVISVGAHYALLEAGFSSSEKYSSQSTRLD